MHIPIIIRFILIFGSNTYSHDSLEPLEKSSGLPTVFALFPTLGRTLISSH